MEQSNIFDTTIRDRPEEWTVGVWREVYDFLPGGGNMANRTDLYIEGKFRNDVDPKDGFPVRDCRDAREHRVLEFLVPIVHQISLLGSPAYWGIPYLGLLVGKDQ